MEVDEWAAPKGSYSLSVTLWVKSRNKARLPAGKGCGCGRGGPVRILCGVGSWMGRDIPQITRSFGVYEDAPPMVDGQCQFDHAEASAQNVPGLRTGIDKIQPKLGGKLRQLRSSSRAHVYAANGWCREGCFWLWSRG